MANEFVLGSRVLVSSDSSAGEKYLDEGYEVKEASSSPSSQWTLYDEKLENYRSNWVHALQLEDILKSVWKVQDVPHFEEDQVDLDVRRSFVYYPKDPSEALTTRLNDLICQVLRAHPELSYYQGYHDIAQVVLLVFGEEKSPFVLERLSLWYLRDYMMPDISTTMQLLILVPQLISAIDVEFGSFLMSAGAEIVELPEQQCFFSISSLMTLFAHNVQDFHTICDIFSFIFESSPQMPIFIYVALVLDQKERLLEFADDKPILHSLLSTVAQDFEGDFGAILESAQQLFVKYPLSSLKQWSVISRYSMMKTSKNSDPQVLDENIQGLLAIVSESKIKEETELRLRKEKRLLAAQEALKAKAKAKAKAATTPADSVVPSGLYTSAAMGLLAITAFSYYYWNISNP